MTNRLTVNVLGVLFEPSILAEGDLSPFTEADPFRKASPTDTSLALADASAAPADASSTLVDVFSTFFDASPPLADAFCRVEVVCTSSESFREGKRVINSL
jgi:hypothetical protein